MTTKTKLTTEERNWNRNLDALLTKIKNRKDGTVSDSLPLLWIGDYRKAEELAAAGEEGWTGTPGLAEWKVVDGVLTLRVRITWTWYFADGEPMRVHRWEQWELSGRADEPDCQWYFVKVSYPV